MSQQPFSYSYPPQESPFAQTLREADENFYATFPDARIAAEQQGRLSSSKQASDFGVSFYLNSQLYQNQSVNQGGHYTVGYVNSPRTAPTIESNLHFSYLAPENQSPFQQSPSVLPQIQSNGHLVQSSPMAGPQYTAAQSTFNDVPPLAWATPTAVVQGGYRPSNLNIPAQSASGLHARGQQLTLNAPVYPATPYRSAMVAPVATVNSYPETTYQPSPSVLPSPPVPYLPTHHAPAPSPPSVQRHSRDRRSQSHPYPISVKVEDKSNALASPLASPIRPAHHPGHSRPPTQVQSTVHRSSPSRGLSWSPGRSSPSRQSTSNGRSGVPLSPLPSKRQIEKKPPLACLFCRGRKIACGPPVAGSLDRTCNQCQRRCLQCEYPAESRRGMRKKKNTDSTGSAEQSQTSVTTPPTFPGEGTLEP